MQEGGHDPICYWVVDWRSVCWINKGDPSWRWRWYAGGGDPYAGGTHDPYARMVAIRMPGPGDPYAGGSNGANDPDMVHSYGHGSWHWWQAHRTVTQTELLCSGKI